ncbi:MAG: DHH family phosphoesterase, partial [Bacillota bacterium]
MNKNTDLKTIAEMLFSAKKVVLFPHVNPDGDSTGSCAALSLALRSKGVECWVCAGSYPSYMKHINGEAFTLDQDKVYGADIAVAVDCSADNRLDSRLEAYRSGKVQMCIDHHMNTEGYGEIYYIDEDAAAVSEIVYEIIKESGADITRDIANAVYTGIVTDTGGFRYSNTTPKSHDLASELMNIGVDHQEIIVNLYNNKNLKKVRAENKAIENMMFFSGGKGVISHLTSGEMAEMDAHPEDCDEIIDRLRDIDGVEMAAYLEEREEGIKVSMRAKTTGSV